MKNYNNNFSPARGRCLKGRGGLWFTLVEVIVSITIFSIIIVSIIGIYITSHDVSVRSEINRIMQENIKNVVTTISEDVRNNGIAWVSSDALDTCDIETWSSYYKSWDKLCTKSFNKYYLAKKNDILNQYIRVKPEECSSINDHCYIVSKDNTPLTNDQVSVKNLSFNVSNQGIPKVTINLEIVPNMKLWINRELIKDNKIILQTTVSQRPF